MVIDARSLSAGTDLHAGQGTKRPASQWCAAIALRLIPHEHPHPILRAYEVRLVTLKKKKKKQRNKWPSLRMYLRSSVVFLPPAWWEGGSVQKWSHSLSLCQVSSNGFHKANEKKKHLRADARNPGLDSVSSAPNIPARQGGMWLPDELLRPFIELPR